MTLYGIVSWGYTNVQGTFLNGFIVKISSYIASLLKGFVDDPRQMFYKFNENQY